MYNESSMYEGVGFCFLSLLQDNVIKSNFTSGVCVAEVASNGSMQGKTRCGGSECCC